MKLFEYETKNLLKGHGIPTPKGEVVANPTEARFVGVKLKPPFVVKAQVLLAGRGKLGGVLFANSIDEIQKAAETLFEKEIKGISVKKILIEEKILVKKELYIGITIDRSERKYALITSEKGGADIEEIAIEKPKQITKTFLDPRVDFRASMAKRIAGDLGYKASQQTLLAKILGKFVRMGLDYDSELIEINPLAETEDGEFIAVDARLIIDDNALFRHEEYKDRPFEIESGNTREEIEALKEGLAYVKLEGNIGVLGNGAGLVMATLDMIQHYGGKPANFLDLGGGAPIERIAAAVKIVLADPNVRVLIINILGGITKCDEVARGIVDAQSGMKFQLPTVVRLVGTNEREGKEILNEAGIRILDSMDEATQLAVALAKD